MTESPIRQRLSAHLNGVIIILLSVYWIFRNLRFIVKNELNSFQLTEAGIQDMTTGMAPGWILMFEAFLGLAGIIIGLSVYKEKKTTLRAYFIVVMLWIIGLYIEDIARML